MKKNNIIIKILYILILFQPLLDIITSLMTRYLDIRITLGFLVRGFLFVLSIIYLFFISKSKYQKKSKIYVIILSLFAFLYFATKLEIFENKTIIFNEIIYLFKYFYTLIMLITLFNVFDEYKPNNRKIFKYLQITLFTYCFSIVLANITNTAFGTYTYGMGNAGWFYAGNEISIILAILFPLIYLLINKATNFWILLYAIPIVLAIEIIGTKTSMLGLLLPTIVFFLYFLIRVKNNKWKQLLITFVLLLVIVIPSANLPVTKNLENSVNRFEEREKSTNKDEDLTDKVIDNVIFSDRDYYAKKISKIYSNSNITKKLFGIGFTNRSDINNRQIEKLIEMDYYDIFYRYGIIGFIIYIFPFIIITFDVIKLCIKNKFRLNAKQLTLGYMSYVGLAIAYIVGHTLGAPAVAFYLDISIVMLIYYLEHGQYKIELDDRKISILALHLNVGGVEKYISDLCKMMENNFNIEVISTYKIKDKPAFYFSDKIKIKYLINDYPRKEEFKKSIKDKNIINIFKYGFNLMKLYILRYLKNVRYVEEINSKYIVTTRYFHNRIVGSNKNRDTIAIATEHNYHNNDNKYVRKVVNSCNNIDYLVLVSEDLKKFYSKLLQDTETVYIPNVIENISVYKEKMVINNKLISVGRLEKEKGYSDLIDIVNIVKEKIPNIKLDIYGNGSLKQSLENKIESLKLENNIELKGNIMHDELQNKYKEYDIYVMTSFTESFGIVLLEAMAQSVTCIAFDSANGAKMLLDNYNGVLIKDRNKCEYANKILNLLSNKDELNKISKRAYKEVKKYDIENVKKEWLKLLDKN